MAIDLLTAWLSNDMVTADELISRMGSDELKDLVHKLAALAERIDEGLDEDSVSGKTRRPAMTSAASRSSRAGHRKGRYQVRGPHGTSRDYARWTVVDTADRDIAVHAGRTKADATATARELNAQQAANATSPTDS